MCTSHNNKQRLAGADANQGQLDIAQSIQKSAQLDAAQIPQLSGRLPNSSTQASSKPFTTDFSIGEPALVCRWRLQAGELPLENRHLRALSRRLIDNKTLPRPLIAWAKEHIEWTLRSGSLEAPDGVLLVVIDHNHHAVMSVGPYQGLVSSQILHLLERSQLALAESEVTGVTPESLWVVEDQRLIWGHTITQTPSGIESLVLDLAQARHITVEHDPKLLERLATGNDTYLEAFMTSDEHGIVLADTTKQGLAATLQADYQRLLAHHTKRQKRPFSV